MSHGFCEDLEPIAQTLIALGNAVAYVDMSYGYRVTLRHAVDRTQLLNTIQKPPFVALSRSARGEDGLTCTRHHCALFWPGRQDHPQVCTHLQPVVDVLRDQGNVVKEADWDPGDLFVWRYRERVHFPTLQQRSAISATLEHWCNTDIHFALVEGLTCPEHGQIIMWPLNDQDVKRLTGR